MQISNIQDLIRHMAAGHPAQFMCFWGYKKAASGLVSETCLSQWYDAPFMHEGQFYRTVEHFMMAQKARLFGDTERHALILAVDTPAKAKALGRAVANFDSALWDDHKVEIVMRGNLEKFSQHADLKSFLIGTNPAILVEASPEDRIWGAGLAEDDPDIQNPSTWPGQNLLGFALMAVRRRIMTLD